MSIIQRADELLVRHHNYISTSVLAIALVVTLGLISPTILLAEETAPPATTYEYTETYSQPPQNYTESMPTYKEGTPPEYYKEQPPSQFEGSGPDSYKTSPPPIGSEGYQKESDGYQTSPPPMDRPGDQPMNYGERTGQYDQKGSGDDSFAQQDERMKAEEERRNTQQLAMLKRAIYGMEQGVKQFERQVARLTKQGITIPTTVTDKLARLKELFAAVKGAENFDKAQEDLQEISEAMQSLHEEQQVLEKLSRWPQTIKQIDKMIKQFDRRLKQNKALAAKLNKKGFAVDDVFAKFELSVNNLKEVRAKAVDLAKTDIDQAYDLLEDEFFDKVEEIAESERVLQQLANLGRFSSEFTRGIKQAEKMIKTLERKKIDVSALKEKLAAIKEQGEEIKRLMKEKPLNEEALVDAFEEMQSSHQEFEELADEVSGVDEDLPWEQGKQQFNLKPVSQEFTQFIPTENGGNNEKGFGGGDNFSSPESYGEGFSPR